MEKYDADKYKWRGFKPRIGRSYYFCWKPNVIKGANGREFQFLWWRISVLWWWNPHSIWNDGWDACFRQNMNESAFKDKVIESTKVYNRKN